MSAHKKDGLGVRFDAFVAHLDTWIAARKPNEIIVMALAIPLILLALDYQFIVPKTQKMDKASQTVYNKTRDDIRKFESGGGEAEVVHLREETSRARDNIDRLNTTDLFIQSRLTELDHLFFTRLEWAQHLDFVTQKATEYQVSIQVQENVVEPEKDGFAPVMSVSLDGQGGFTSVLRYLFLVEASEKITPIEELTLKIDDQNRLAFKAKSVLWGLR
jgi:hypothetical protein